MALVSLLTVIGFATVSVNGRRIEIAQFRSDAGTLMLGIPKAGKYAAQHDAFVALVAKQIPIAKCEAQAATSVMQSGAGEA